MANLASSIFNRTPDESTVVEDVYKKNNDTTVNSFQDQLLSGFDLSNQLGFLSKFTSGNVLKTAIDGSLSLDKDSLTDKISAAFSDDYSKAKSLISDFATGAKSIVSSVKATTNEVTGLLKQAQSVYYTVNGIVNTVKTGNLSDLRGICNTLNAVAGRTSIALSANGALGGIMSGLVGEAGAQGIQGAFGIVADTIQQADYIQNKGQMIYQVATGSLPGAIARGDLGSVASMVDYMGSGAVSMMNPSAVSSLARNDKTSYTPAQIGGSAGQFVQYQGAYQKIDPNWNTSSWTPVSSSQPVRDLSSLLDASSQVKNIFTTGGKLSTNTADKLYSALSVFGSKKSVDDEIRKQYPTSAVADTSNICSRDVDPILYFTEIK